MVSLPSMGGPPPRRSPPLKGLKGRRCPGPSRPHRRAPRPPGPRSPRRSGGGGCPRAGTPPRPAPRGRRCGSGRRGAGCQQRKRGAVLPPRLLPGSSRRAPSSAASSWQRGRRLQAPPTPGGPAPSAPDTRGRGLSSAGTWPPPPWGPSAGRTHGPGTCCTDEVGPPAPSASPRSARGCTGKPPPRGRRGFPRAAKSGTPEGP
mmetsp:Transcript_6417/g.18175  ORF Transcript_6417/g.18175 Transcript_6417/m.18175 type:complete len:203 (+) Transcript_6417:589-1197(+)